MNPTTEQLRDLLCCAFEGGSNYWYSDLHLDPDNPVKPEAFKAGGAAQDPNCYWHWSQLAPTLPMCAVKFKDLDGQEHTLDNRALLRGWTVMQESCRGMFARVIADDTDAAVGDVFLQCCVFGEVVYG